MLLFTLFACASPSVSLVEARDLGVLPYPQAVQARDGGYSGTFQGRSVWLYGDTILNQDAEDGSRWRHNTFSWTRDARASDGLDGFEEPLDEAGAPLELFVSTEAEAAYNALHAGEDCAETPCGAREVLWPMAMVEDPARDRALVFFVKIHGEPGAWNFFSRGHGVAIWDDPDGHPWRPEPGVDPEHPTLLFPGDTDNYGAAALVEGDHVYTYACDTDGWGKPCRVGRAPLATVEVREDWRFWDGEAWSADIGDAAEVFDGASQMSVQWNEALGMYLALYVPGLTDTITLRTAPAPEGPWSREVALMETLPAAEDWVYCGIGHPEYDDGANLYVTYYRTTEPWHGEVRLVELTLE
ncbi:MAG: DUF4185 domain-containing protein [Alphaproteobacteria bacterium]|nr:DUF4185 domain-containing protein [Alphaproteobacteria bacterium]